MKFSIGAGVLATALAAATTLTAASRVNKVANLEAIHIVVSAGGEVTISSDVLDHGVKLSVLADVATSGELAVPATQFAALVAAFPIAEMVTITTANTTAYITCNRSRFRLPAVPLDQLPAPLTLGAEIGGVEVAREEALALFARPLFAAAKDDRFYLNGIFLHTSKEGLTAVATDGHRLCRTTVPDAVGLSTDRRLIVPRAAVRLITKLLNDKRNERIMLRRSVTLLAVEATTFTFVSKLIDANFPSYERVVPIPSGNAITVDRRLLAQAVARIAAVTDPHVKATPRVGFSWQSDEPALHLCLAGFDTADDVIEAQTAGVGRFAFQIWQLRELLDEIEGERVHFDLNGGGGPILITDPDDGNYLVAQMPCVWSVVS